MPAPLAAAIPAILNVALPMIMSLGSMLKMEASPEPPAAYRPYPPHGPGFNPYMDYLPEECDPARQARLDREIQAEWEREHRRETGLLHYSQRARKRQGPYYHNCPDLHHFDYVKNALDTDTAEIIRNQLETYSTDEAKGILQLVREKIGGNNDYFGSRRPFVEPRRNRSKRAPEGLFTKPRGGGPQLRPIFRGDLQDLYATMGEINHQPYQFMDRDLLTPMAKHMVAARMKDLLVPLEPAQVDQKLIHDSDICPDSRNE